jgi:predicted component of type VI protein secretion system
MTRRTPTGARAAAALGLTALLVAAACSSSAQLRFRCDNPINGGLLLTVDVVRASEEQARMIQSLGERWFYDPNRETLRSSGGITTVTFPTNDPSGQCTRDVKVPVSGKDKYLVIVADYKFQSPDASKQVVTLSRDRFKGSTVRIALHDRELSVETK